MDDINIYNEDCMALMARTPDQTYDLAIVDPPYFDNARTLITPGGNLSTTGVERRKYPMPHWVPPDPAYFRELFRVSKHQIIWGINYFPIKNPGPGRIVWDKVRDNGTDFSDCEIAYCSLLQKVRIVRYLWNGMLQGRSIQEGTIMRGNKRQNEKRIHPTQKPVPLYRWLLEQYAAPLADVAPIRILDTHLGSGSIAIACHDLIEEGCRFSLDAAEIDPLYYHAALQWYQDHAQQQSFRFGS